jgi:hypothetical protein
LDRVLRLLHGIDQFSVLHRICLVCVDLTSMAGAGVSRIVDGRHDTLDASDGFADGVESLQVELAEGPCVEAVATFRPWVEPDLTAPSAVRRWPRFAPAALERGVAAAFAFPLITGGVAVGALDVYSTRPGPMMDAHFEDTVVLAGLAALAVESLDRPSGVTGVDLAAEPAEEWAHAAVVHNASGMVSVQLGVSVEEALVRLRAVAFATERRVADVARDVVERKLRIESWTDRG